MNSPPRMVFWMISSTSLTWHFVYSQPSGSMRTSGPISQKAVAAGLFQADGVGVVLGQGHLARDAQLVHALFELMIDVQVAAGDTARAAADEDLALFRVARGHVVGLQGAELLQGFDSLTHYAPSFSRSSSMRSTALSGVMAGCTVSLTMTTGLRPHAPRHDTISMVNRPSSEVGLLSLRPVAS